MARKKNDPPPPLLNSDQWSLINWTVGTIGTFVISYLLFGVYGPIIVLLAVIAIIMLCSGN
jgi:hypothetical protein